MRDKIKVAVCGYKDCGAHEAEVSRVLKVVHEILEDIITIATNGDYVCDGPLIAHEIRRMRGDDLSIGCELCWPGISYEARERNNLKCRQQCIDEGGCFTCAERKGKNNA